MENLLRDIEFKEFEFPEGTTSKRPSGVAIDAGLERYNGEWNKTTATHLLRRATFGPKIKDIVDFTNMNLDSAVDKLLEFNEPLELPLNYADKDDPYVKLGESWFGLPDGQNTFGPRINSFLARWFGNILNSGNSVGEKMTLFWHNHFVTQMLTVRDEDNSFVYYKTLRENCLGNFKELAEKMTIDPAMLRFLNGNENIVGRPNENYGRELMELFTIGKGPLIGPGNYTNYTEDDVVAAAKVLTGWRALRDSNESKFYPQLHDKSIKQFSSAYGNHTISNNNENEYKDLIEMIFAQKEIARFISRKLYRWFVYYEIDQQTEDNVITPMADLLRANNYEVKPVLKALFSSAHFYNYWNIGCVIKSPLDFVVGLYRNLEMKFPSDYKGQYNSWLELGANYVAVQEMLLGEPPSVAGWPAMYQEPTYHRLWITSVSAPYRAVIADYVASQTVIKGRTYEIGFDAFELAKQTSKPVDPNILIKELAEFLLPVELTDYQLEYLKSNLLPNGLQDSQWSAVWAGYIAQPENQTNTDIVNSLLRNLLRACLNIAEYHLI